MQKLLKQLRSNFPHLLFESGPIFSWSPIDQKITYKASKSKDPVQLWSLLHELSHALLGHKTYNSDFELIQMEAAAWDKACELASQYEIEIDQDHVQDCLDTYRDWLHKRSTCPVCQTHSFQQDNNTYCCFNCSATWRVSSARMCRPYRKLAVS